MPRAFLVKKRGPKRGSPPAGGGLQQHPQEESTISDDIISTNISNASKGHTQKIPIRIDFEEEDDDEDGVGERVGLGVVMGVGVVVPQEMPRAWSGWMPTPDGISPERAEDGPRGRAEVPRSPSPRPGSRLQEQEERDRPVVTLGAHPTTKDRYGLPEARGREGVTVFLAPSPGAGPASGDCPGGAPRTLGKSDAEQMTYNRSPDAAPEPERMAFHRSPDVPTSSLSSSVARSIGYITSSPTKTHTPRITIERTPPGGAGETPISSRPYQHHAPAVPPPPALPMGERTSRYVSTPGRMSSSSASPLWAPHRDIGDRTGDFRSPPPPSSSSEFHSPPSYREAILRFPSPDLPSPPPPSTGLHHHHTQYHQQHRYLSPGAGHHQFDFELDTRRRVPLQAPPPVPHLPVHSVFDRRPLPPPPPPPTSHRSAPSALRLSTGNSLPLTPLGPATTPSVPHHPMTSSPSNTSRMSSGGYLLERGSPPRKRTYPGGDADGMLREYPRGVYDGRYPSWAVDRDAGTQPQSAALNMSTVKENNGCKEWRDCEPLGERPTTKPRIPWGIENIPLDEEDLKAIVPKKRRENDPPRYQCEACKKSYATHGGLSKHRQFHCTSIIKKEFSCKSCDKTYVSLGALKMHIRTHTLPCKCHLCGKAFARPWLLQGHIRTHTGEKPYQCAHCGRSFADRSNLRAHLQTHTDIKKYNCRSCSKSFSRMSLLSKHEDGGCGNTSI